MRRLHPVQQCGPKWNKGLHGGAKLCPAQGALNGHQSQQASEQPACCAGPGLLAAFPLASPPSSTRTHTHTASLLCCAHSATSTAVVSWWVAWMTPALISVARFHAYASVLRVFQHKGACKHRGAHHHAARLPHPLSVPLFTHQKQKIQYTPLHLSETAIA